MRKAKKDKMRGVDIETKMEGRGNMREPKEDTMREAKEDVMM